MWARWREGGSLVLGGAGASLIRARSQHVLGRLACIAGGGPLACMAGGLGAAGAVSLNVTDFDRTQGAGADIR